MAIHHNTHQLCQQILAQWRQEKIALHVGATEQELTDFETKYDVKLPDDFRYLYSLANGMVDGETDRYLFCLWPLALTSTEHLGVIIERNATPPRLEIAFGDYCLDVRRYYLAQQGEEFIVKSDLENEVMATSFTNFLEIYLSTPEKLLL